MAKIRIEPRTYRGFFSPSPREAYYFGEGWMEAEEFCYPSGGMLRKAFAYDEEQKRYRVVYCGIPDTFFSIPGFVREKGRRIRGYVTQVNEILIFVRNK